MAKPDTKRLPRLEQTPDRSPKMRLTARDIAILEAVYAYRALTTEQIQRLFFAPSTRSQCLLRLKLLFHHGFLKRGEQPQTMTEGRKPFVYWLDRTGAEFIAIQQECEVADLDWQPKQHLVKYLYLDHLLATNDVRIAFSLAAQTHGYTIPTWRDDKTLKRDHAHDTVTLRGPEGGIEQAAVVPDGYFVLDTGEHHYQQSLEVDRRTVTGEATRSGAHDWARKVAVYLAYIRSGKYEARYGSMKGRIITVTTGEKRLANLQAITEKAGGKARFWFTTFAQATPEAILTEPIWAVASKEGRYPFLW